MAKPRLVKVRALFYVFQYITKQRGCANFDTASLFPGYLFFPIATRIIPLAALFFFLGVEVVGVAADADERGTQEALLCQDGHDAHDWRCVSLFVHRARGSYLMAFFPFTI